MALLDLFSVVRDAHQVGAYLSDSVEGALNLVPLASQGYHRSLCQVNSLVALRSNLIQTFALSS